MSNTIINNNKKKVNNYYSYSIDKLQLTVNCSDNLESILHTDDINQIYKAKKEGLILLYKGYGNRFYAHTYVVFCVDTISPVAVLWTQPRFSGHSKNVGTLKIENAILYSQKLKLVISQIFTELPISYKKLSELHLAVDGLKLPYPIATAKMLKSLASKKYRVKKLSKLTPVYDEGDSNIPSYIRFGTNSSVFSAVIYNKIKEIKSESAKFYILDKWKRDGLIYDNDVWRLEFRLRQKQFDIIEETMGEYIGDNTDINYILDNYENLFMSLAHNKFVILDTTTHTRYDRMKVISPIIKSNKNYKIKYKSTTQIRTSFDKEYIRKLFINVRIAKICNMPSYKYRRELLLFEIKDIFVKLYLYQNFRKWNSKIIRDVNRFTYYREE